MVIIKMFWGEETQHIFGHNQHERMAVELTESSHSLLAPSKIPLFSSFLVVFHSSVLEFYQPTSLDMQSQLLLPNI